MSRHRHRIVRRSVRPIIALVALVWSCAPLLAETHALVVGIDRYRNIRPLRGAVADARDIGEALRGRGVRNLTVLLDEDATRARILDAIDAMIRRAAHDDLVIISFAGHGGRERWGKLRPPGVEPGASREVFLLSEVSLPNVEGRIDPRLGGSAGERIAGAEMNAKLRALEAKGARVIFLADTCHGGGMSRSPLIETEDEQGASTFRSIKPYVLRDDEDPLARVLGNLPASVDTDRELRGLTFLAAVEDTKLAPEVAIPKGSRSWRGALSYAFARVIDGTAPLGASGKIGRGDLIDYVQATIATHAENRQDPDLRPRANFDAAVIDVMKDFGGMAPRPSSALAAAAPMQRVSVFGAGPGAFAAAGQMANGIAIDIASSAAEADLILRDGKVYSKSGDLIVLQARTGDLPGWAAREVALRRLLALSLERPRSLRLSHGDRRYAPGEDVSVEAVSTSVGDTAEVHYVLFNIAGDGQVQFLYPQLRANGFRRDDPLLLRPGTPLVQIKTSPPAGTDMIVLVTDTKPLATLAAQISRLDGRREPLRAVEAIAGMLGAGSRIGLQGLFTAPGDP